MTAYFYNKNSNYKVFTASLTFRPANIGLINIVITIFTRINILLILTFIVLLYDKVV